MLVEDFNLPLANCHTHAAMVGFRALAEDKPLGEWLEKYIWPMEAKLTPEKIRNYTREAIKEMKKNKTGVFADMYFFEDEVAKVAMEEEIPVVIGEGLLEFPTPSYKTFEEGLEITKKLLEKYKDNPLVKVSVSPHSIYTVNAEHLKEAKELAKEYNSPYHIHCSETQKEFNDCLKEHNKTPVKYLDELGVLDENTLLAHCVWLEDEDIKIIKNRGSSVVHCPLSNCKLGSGVAPVKKLIDSGILVCLGTDGAASSNRLDIWEAGKVAGLLQKAVNLDPSVLPVAQIIRMMTVNGMKALGFEELNGMKKEDIEREIKNNDYSHLYHLNVS